MGGSLIMMTKRGCEVASAVRANGPKIGMKSGIFALFRKNSENSIGNPLGYGKY